MTNEGFFVSNFTIFCSLLNGNYYNLKIAEAKALQITQDIIFNRFDGNVEKYKVGYNPQLNVSNDKQNIVSFPKQNRVQPNLKQLWETYRKLKGKQCQSSQRIWNNISKLIERIESEDSTLLELENNFHLWSWLKDNFADSTISLYFRTINPAINLAVDQRIIDFNCYQKLLKHLGNNVKKTVSAYSKEEVKTILDAFYNDQFIIDNNRYPSSYYGCFVELRALTAMRPSEAIALTWSDLIIKNETNWIRINKKYIKGEIEHGTKNGVDIRLFPVNNQLKDLLQRIPKIDNEHNLIFPSNKDKSYINSDNFSKRYWITIVRDNLFEKGLISQYLPFYDFRHTMISHAVRSGQIDIKTLASLVGNSPKVLMERYLAVDDDVFFPELY